MSEPSEEIFLSVAGPDLPWGRWIDLELRRVGYRVHFYERSFVPGFDFVNEIDKALDQSDRVILVLSPAYLDPHSWVQVEWQSAFRMARERRGFLLPVMVEACEPRPLLGGLSHVSLIGLDEHSARRRLLAALRYDGRWDRSGHDQAPFPGLPEDHILVSSRASFPGPHAADIPETPTPATPTAAHPVVADIDITRPTPASSPSLKPVGTGGTTAAVTRITVAAWTAICVVTRVLAKRWRIGLVVGLVVAMLATTAVVVWKTLRPGGDPPSVELRRLWHAQVGGAVTGASQLIGGMLVVGVDRDDGGLVRAFDAVTGAERWRPVDVGTWPTAPVIVSGNVYFGSARFVSAVSASSGLLLWEKGTDGRVLGSPIIVDGKVFVGSEDRHLYVFDAGAGWLLERLDMHGPVVSAPTASHGVIYVSTRDGWLYALDSVEVEVRWKVQLGSSPLSAPVVSGGQVYVASEDGHINIVESDKGAKLEPLPVAGVVGEAMTVVDNVLYISARDGRVLCVDLGDQRQRCGGGPVGKDLTMPLVHGAHIYVGDARGFLYALDTRDGRISWSAECGNGRLRVLAVSGNRVFTADTNGMLVAWELPAGSVTDLTRPGGTVTARNVVPPLPGTGR